MKTTIVAFMITVGMLFVAPLVGAAAEHSGILGILTLLVSFGLLITAITLAIPLI